MSGHSKWSQIKHQKGAADKKRGKLFSVLSKRISIAARLDQNPDTNLGLKSAIDKAKAANMPGEIIKRAIKRGAGELDGQGQIEEMIYEAYGPDGVQLLIVAATDNRNRATANIRHILTKAGGSLSGKGSVMWNFERGNDGYVAKTKQEVDKATEEKIDHLIRELEEDEDVEEVFTNLE
jgi:YebC/PmpR family DNA-binding regulatory protein